ncbi:MAG: two-component system sensor histidine kinase TctE [Paracoccaceae bacterium]|jgi:two-component system sensor histidine kinase TctE
MSSARATSPSIRQRLVLQLVVVAALLSGLLYLSVRTVADAAVETTQDSILGAATTTIADELRGGEDGIEVDIPYTAFSMLGAIGQDRVFYRIMVGDQTVTGYDDLPAPDGTASGLEPRYYSRPFRDVDLRIAAVSRTVLVQGRAVEAVIIVGQTRQGQAAIVANMANRAAALGLGFFVVATLLSILTAGTVLRPINRLAEAVGRRGPQDLRPIHRDAPRELAPFVTALNGFITRLGGALSRTETFIAEAAHHIRTPLATVRAQAEIALRQTNDDATRTALRSVVRAVDASARSAGQLLDHATVVYRTDQRTDERLDLGALTRNIARAFEPTADLREIVIALDVPVDPVQVTGDRLLLESALRNLVDNAIKYADPETQVDIALKLDSGRAEILVCDRGRGLSGVQAQALTKRFQRGENVGDVVGSGLGLTIVNEVAQAAGGSFDIVNRKGGGACATLQLPLS